MLSPPGTIAPVAIGTIEATARGRLIALRGCAPFAAPALLGTALLTVDVAAIAARADQHLDAAARAEVHAHGCICLFTFVTQTWTKVPAGGIVPRHTCSARCGARRRNELPGCDRRRACLQRRQTSSAPTSALGVAASRGAHQRTAYAKACLAVQPSKEMVSSQADCAEALNVVATAAVGHVVRRLQPPALASTTRASSQPATCGPRQCCYVHREHELFLGRKRSSLSRR